MFWNYNEKGNKKWSGLLHYLFYYTEWWKSQYKRTEQISLQWHGFECSREFLESKFYSLRFPCPFGKTYFLSRIFYSFRKTIPYNKQRITFGNTNEKKKRKKKRKYFETTNKLEEVCRNFQKDYSIECKKFHWSRNTLFTIRFKNYSANRKV